MSELAAALAMEGQRSAGAVADGGPAALLGRVGRAVYAIAFYPLKTFLPLSLSPLYARPVDSH